MESAMESGSDDEGSLRNGDKYKSDLSPDEAIRILTRPVSTQMDEEE